MPAKLHQRALLITGATGMVGARVLAECLKKEKPCALIARAKGRRSAVDRVDSILQRYESHWSQKLPRPTVFDGDLNQPNLGLDAEAIEWITKHCDEVLHSAASLSFSPAAEDPNNEPYRTNLGGTGNVLALSQKIGLKHFHHVSTAYVCGLQNDTVREDSLNVGQSFANDYERSKLQAELMLSESLPASGLTIYRPSIVVDLLGLSPLSGDRTIYGAFAMYQMLAARFGLPEPGEWFRELGFTSGERKNLVDVNWIAEAMWSILSTPALHGKTYHLTAQKGTSIEELDTAFRNLTIETLNRRTKKPNQVSAHQTDGKEELDQLAAPFVQTFLPYFKDDPTFDRTNIDIAQNTSAFSKPPAIGPDELRRLIELQSPTSAKPKIQTVVKPKTSDDDDPIVICGYEVRLPGGVDCAADFEKLLWDGQSALQRMPDDRLDRSLYFDSKRGVPGKTYTEIGGCVDPQPLSQDLERQIRAIGEFDLAHRQFAHVAVAAMASALPLDQLDKTIDLNRAGVFVGHSGGTQDGGALALATMSDVASSLIDETDAPVPGDGVAAIRREVSDNIRRDRPLRKPNGMPELNAYAAASLAARLLGFRGRREVIDAACSSSLLALHHAASAIDAGHLDVALVGGATYNNVDNLALFSQTGACSDTGSYPFDQRASGLVSSEGYVAVVLTKRSVAEASGMPIIANLLGVGVSSDGKGKGLWAPRSEGQQLAIRRASENLDQPPLDVDYLECHATSTQVGDATELTTLSTLVKERTSGNASSSQQLHIGSVKSNLGHLLEAAGLVGMVKCILAMHRGQIPPSINFSQPTESFDWRNAPLRVVDGIQQWPDQDSRTTAINAFGIGGLNGHAVISQTKSRTANKARLKSNEEPIAIVGRGLILPGADSVSKLAALLRSGKSVIGDAPDDRWPMLGDHPIGICAEANGPCTVPHNRGGYISGFQFNAQSYRIPPKTVANANPAQLMLIDAVRQAMDEYDGGQWTVDRKNVGVVIGTMFGGQFSNELQIGLRLPEICKYLIEAAKSRGVSDQEARTWAEAYEQRVLDRYSALLDETGGFTASTLASRIARTFDLMGGACAVDADEASSGLAVLTSIEQLRSGSVDMMLCGTAQRSMDLVALDQLYRNNRLVPSGEIADLPNDGSRVFPAEGVAIIVMQRLSDAVAAGRKIFGTIDSASEDFAESIAAARALAAETSRQNDTFDAKQLIRQLGNLGGGQGIVRCIAATIAHQSDNDSSTNIDEIASDGYSVRYTVSPYSPLPKTSISTGVTKPNIEIAQGLSTEQQAGIAKRIETPCVQSMKDALKQLMQTGDCSATVSKFGSSGLLSPVQAAIVATSSEEFAKAAKALLDGPVANNQSGALSRYSAWVRLAECSGDRVAWLFPGQGSQYSDVPSAFSDSRGSIAAESLKLFDQELSRLNLQPIGSRLNDPDRQLGKDVWWTQAWLLAVGTALTQTMLARGLRPDVVLGHSFGECTAAWAAGAMDTRQAIQFAKSRSDAVVMSGGPRGQLLSVRGEPSQVDAALRAAGSDCVVTHHNAPQQTVVAGSAEQIALAQAQLTAIGTASVVISVPTAFHTPKMEPARQMLLTRQGDARYRPPRFGFLSAIQNKYLSEPNDILLNLIDQLVKPVCFTSAVDRLIDDGVGLMVEIGPNNVLSRLASASAMGRAICISADDRSLDGECQSQLIDLASEAFGGQLAGRTVSASTIRASNTTAAPSSNGHAKSPSKTNKSFDVVDVTRRSRRTESAPPAAERNGHTGSKNGSAPKPQVPSDRVANAVDAVGPIAGQTASTPPNAPATSAVATENRLETAKSFLLDLVLDLTGYDPDIIEFDADLEAELGVDSIKKAQLIGELVQWAGLNLTTKDITLGDFNSLDDILGLLGQQPEPIATTAAIEPSAVPAPVQPSEPTDDVDPDLLQRLMIDLLVDQTGYDEEIIDMDADLESELGVDSIKRAQLLGELQQQFELPPIQPAELKLSDFPTLRSIHSFIIDQASGSKKKTSQLADPSTQSAAVAASIPRDLPVPGEGTHRFVLNLRSADRQPDGPTNPVFFGPGLVIGDNAVADEIIRRWKHESEFPIDQIKAGSLNDLDQQLEELWQTGVSQHVFLTTPWDEAAIWSVSDQNSWLERCESAIQVPYRVCQLWMQRSIDDGLMERSSLVTALRGGGDFGLFSKDDERNSGQSRSAESGGLAGLTKAMLIEAWMREHRDTPMLIVDSVPGESVTSFVEGMWRELAVPSYDEEVIVADETRLAIEPSFEPLNPPTAKANQPTRFPLTRGGNWVVAGGGRGITAYTAMALAERHDLTLHMLGMAPCPDIDPQTREHAMRDRSDLRRVTMRRIQAEGGNPVKTWRQLEKVIEIDLTLEECKRRGIRATYHSVDISDAEAVDQALQKIRQTDGPIRGVIQGAGSGQDARFDRKRPDKVRQCLSAKIDGTISLASATKDDPLEWFVGFGSISGRFGANGHTDYSAANEMLAKLIGQLGRERPETRCLTFHWHAWGDIGMATKPEAKLALDMIGMKFMPATEGLDHFLAEIEQGGDRSEVLITDRRYIRKFFPCGESKASFLAPMLAPGSRADSRTENTTRDSFAVTLDPGHDLFLTEHLVMDRPTLPLVMAIELLAESAKLQSGQPITQINRVTAIAALKSATTDPFAVELQCDPTDPRTWTLSCDLRRRDGRLVQASRPHFRASSIAGTETCEKVSDKELLRQTAVDLKKVNYVAKENAPVYHGPPLQCLRSLGYVDDHAVGVIVAPSPTHLVGEQRPVTGWVTSPATLDAVLYATGKFAFEREGKPSLPVSIEQIQLGRLPDAGEPLRVVVKWIESDANGAVVEAVLAGQNQDLIARLVGYRIGWLGS